MQVAESAILSVMTDSISIGTIYAIYSNRTIIQ